MQLDSIAPLEARVGYGALGRRGDLGYEGKRVVVAGRQYESALSAHAPSSLVYRLDGASSAFTCHVALNGDVPAGSSHADFVVLADGRAVASAPRVAAGEAPRPLHADIAGATTLELVVRTSRWACCHSTWLDPLLSSAPAAEAAPVLDCLGRTRIHRTVPAPQADRCIATVVSPGFAAHLDDLLGSLCANALCPDALIAVFAVDADDACRRVADKYGATLIPCTRAARINATVKSVMYSAPHVIDAAKFLCLDADMLVLGDLRPVFAAIDAAPAGSILAVREANGGAFDSLEHALCSVYGGQPGDIARLTGSPAPLGRYSLVVNDGIFAGSREALITLDAAIRGWPAAVHWVDERRDISWRNQFVFNLAIAHLDCGAELDGTYNVQLNSQDAALSWSAHRMHALWRGRAARVLHFNGLGRPKYPAFRGTFAGVSEPLTGSPHGDGFAAFLDALRPWIGRLGLPALAWSFYGTASATGARVRDAGVFPLFAALHYLLRSHGCVRVLETGTGRGVSTACIASAVAHRRGGAVVTFDTVVLPERTALWDALPDSARRCIHARAGDSIAGMGAALAAGERYDAALIDSLHLEDHVWEEFLLATRLVCPGGLILVHDVNLPTGTVDRAVRRIEDAGYGVTRLWLGESGVAEDDRLGLALIENRAPHTAAAHATGQARSTRVVLSAPGGAA